MPRVQALSQGTTASLPGKRGSEGEQRPAASSPVCITEKQVLPTEGYRLATVFHCSQPADLSTHTHPTHIHTHREEPKTET